MMRSLVVEKSEGSFHSGSRPINCHAPARIKKLVRSSIDELLVNPESGSELTGELEGYRSLKAKRYRIVYRANDAETTVEILLVGHRRDVYETLRSLLTGED
jgi:addiction module RelE/StbE family toxin